MPLLPYLDQQNIYNAYDKNVYPWHPNNLAAVKNGIGVFICPSTPRNSTLVNVNIPAAVPALNYGAGNPYIIYQGGAIDYLCVEKTVGGIRAAANAAGYTQQNNRNEGPLGEFDSVVVLGVSQLSDRVMSTSIRDVRDGTSNTGLLYEVAGRETLYRKGKPVPVVSSDFTTDHAYAHSINNAGTWDAPFNTLEMQGSSFDGVTVSGPSGINCSNEKGNIPATNPLSQRGGGWYSFHAGGIQMLLCDGSTRFLSESLSPVTINSLVSRDEGDPLGEF